MTYTVMSKRKLLQLVNEKYCGRLGRPANANRIAGYEADRGYTPEAIRAFCDKIGVAKKENIIDLGLLEFCIREDLNKSALPRDGSSRSVKLVKTNYPEGQTEELEW